MKGIGWLISRYLVSNIWPYFLSSWLVLSVILFVQQASRYSDIFFGFNVPSNLVWQLAVALIPNVVAFTCPMAILVGTMIGLTKMQGDSELIAIRAAGIGNFQMTVPVLIFGIVLSLFAFFINIRGVPFASGLVRQVALESAIKKFESPVEPGVFDSAVAGYTIYVGSGDAQTGRWKDIFIYAEDKTAGTMRLVTSNDGRIDTSGQVSELVLENATVSTLPLVAGAGKYASENIGQVRMAVRTKRSDLIDKMTHAEVAADELGLGELSNFASASVGRQRTEAYILLERRILLSITPLIFCLLGTAIVLRFNRRGRGFGIAAALLVLIGFYLLAFLNEQLVRVGALSVYASWLLPVVGSIALLVWLAVSRKMRFRFDIGRAIESVFESVSRGSSRLQMRSLFVDVTTGIRDFDIAKNLFKNFLLALSFLISIFLIFTAFDLWKFAGTFEGGTRMLVLYLIYLLPFVYLQVAPSASMIAVLSTYVVKSRQNEIVTWTSAGQSVYRLLLPCFLLALLLGLADWSLQETVMPIANQLQDEMRSAIRNQGSIEPAGGRYWVVSGNRIMSFELAGDEKGSSQDRDEKHGNRTGASDNEITTRLSPHPTLLLTANPIDALFASDNEKRESPSLRMQHLTIFDFADKGERLQTVYRADRGYWRDGTLELEGSSERDDVSGGQVKTTYAEGQTLVENIDPADRIRVQPNHLSTSGLRRILRSSTNSSEHTTLYMALEKKYSTLFFPFVVALFTAPFSLSLSRKGKAATVGYAVALWLLFTGVSNAGEQFGINGLLSPQLAVWSPLVIFSLLGIYLLSRIRT